MDRQRPPGLSDAQRNVLSEFFAGHISAGQLTQRLGIESSEATRGLASQRQSRESALDGEVPRIRAARTITAPRRWVGLARPIEGLLSLTPKRTET